MFSKKIVRFLVITFLILITTIHTNSTYASCKAQSLNLDFSRYYYNQLNTIEKAIYENLINSQEKFIKSEEVAFEIDIYDVKNNIDLNSYIPLIRKVRKAYIYDNPETDIWFDGYKCALYASKGKIYLKCTPKEATKSIKSEICDFETKCLAFANTLSGTDEEKLKQIHYWLTQNAVYDISLSRQFTRTAYGTIINGYSVCSGFAYAYKYIADLAGLNVLYVVGNLYEAKTNTYSLHAWNVVYINENYSLVDVTLDLHAGDKYLFSPINDNFHYADTCCFNYTF